MNTLTTEQKETAKQVVEKVYSPNVNIFENKENVKLVVEMPGVDQSSVNVNVEKDTLVIEAQFDYDSTTSGKTGLVEFSGGKYFRKFTIGKLVDAENASAKMKNGILELTLPKIEPKKTKIEIQT
jgi:HSP20 family protein